VEPKKLAWQLVKKTAEAASVRFLGAGSLITILLWIYYSALDFSSVPSLLKFTRVNTDRALRRPKMLRPLDRKTDRRRHRNTALVSLLFVTENH
jgi:hypothetical protein